MQPFLSFLIPAYNEEKHIQDTIQNILAQTDSDFELIICDDGSTDRTWEILQKNQKKEKIFVIRNERNLGLYQTRDVLIKNSHGKYIFFVDADDRICENTLAIIKDYIRLSDFDIIYLPLKVSPVKGAKSGACFSNDLPLKDKEKIYGKDIFSFFFKDSDEKKWWNIAGKAFRGDWIRNLDLDENEHIIQCEDFLRSVKLLFFADSFIYVNRKMYKYCVGNGGSGHTRISLAFFCKKIHDIMTVYHKTCNFLINHGMRTTLVHAKMDLWLSDFRRGYLDFLNQGGVADQELNAAIDFFIKECGTDFMHDVIRYKWLHTNTPISLALKNYWYFLIMFVKRWKKRFSLLCSGHKNWFD